MKYKLVNILTVFVSLYLVASNSFGFYIFCKYEVEKVMLLVRNKVLKFSCKYQFWDHPDSKKKKNLSSRAVL